MTINDYETATTPPLVLLVDDQRACRESIRLVLEPRFRVTTADSSEQGMGLLRQQKVDVVILELMTSGLDIIEIFKKIHERDPDVQTVIVSGESLDDLAHVRLHPASAWTPRRSESGWLVEAVERAAEETRCGREQAAESRAASLPEAGTPAHETRDGDERKRDTARMLSHDLKNRMSIVFGFARLLREEKLDSWHTAEALDAIEGNAVEATTQTVNFLHAEETDTGSLEMHKTPVSLNRIIEQVMEDDAPTARLRRIDLRADLDSGLPPVDLDSAMIFRSVANLLGNALHYSPEGDVVRVETGRFGDLMVLRICDHGPGVPAEEVPKLFERYARGAKSAGSSSTGLGLYFVRSIVDAHEGFVSATFPVEGGSAFVIVLPCPPPGNA